MARLFTIASSQYAYAASSPVSTIPATLACWFRRDEDSALPLYMISANTAANDNEEVAIRLGATTHRLEMTGRASDANVSTWITTGTTIGEWTHGAAVWAGATSRILYQNASTANTGSTTSAVSNTPTGLDCLALGSIYRAATPGNYMGGAIAHAAIWNVALSAAEVARLYNSGIGVDPRSVRPDALVAYWPLINGDGDQDYWGNYHLTASGSPTYAQHPPVLMRSRPKYVVIGSGTPTAPTISSVTITGTSQIGSTLTATVVTDQDPVDSTAYQWEIADDGSGTNSADISGETSSTLALTYTDFASRLDANGNAYVRCAAIATKNSLASDEAFSAWQEVTAPSGGGLAGSPLKSPFLIA